VALELLPAGSDVSVDTIAATAGVAVQTIYTQFGSKRGLLIAALDAAQREAGLYADLDWVWSSADGETALRRMAEVTIRLWDRAWPFVAFSERARRTDEEIGRHLAEVDGYRLLNLRAITDRLADEQRLQLGLGAARAADLAFALTVPSVYDELVHARAWPVDDAAATVAATVACSIIDVASPSVIGDAADWSGVLRPPPAID